MVHMSGLFDKPHHTIEQKLAAFEKMLERFAKIEREHQKSGPDRTHEQVLGCFSEFVLAVDEAVGHKTPSAVRVVLNNMTEQHDPYFPRTHPMFIPPAMWTAKTAPASNVSRADKGLVTALCDVLIAQEGEPREATLLRVVQAMREHRYTLPGGRPQTRSAKTQSDAVASRLRKWRKEIKRLKGDDVEWLARGRAWVNRALVDLRQHEASAYLAHEMLIEHVIKRLCENAAHGTNDTLS